MKRRWVALKIKLAQWWGALFVPYVHKPLCDTRYTVTFSYHNSPPRVCTGASPFFIRHPHLGLSRRNAEGSRPSHIHISPLMPADMQDYVHQSLVWSLHPTVDRWIGVTYGRS
jgi:hypothetical protein